jgi:3-deoxy-D-manno-octulosonic acid kinase
MVRLPEEYTLVRAGRVRAAVRNDLVSTLGAWLTAPTLVLPGDAEPLRSGRGAAYRVVLPGGARAVVRFYRRGGLLGRLVRATYFGFRARPLRELTATVETRRRGVPTVEVLAARIEGWMLYRGALVTAEIQDATTLIEALHQTRDAAARTALAASAGRVVGALHRAGVSHADLNLNNLLVRAETSGVSVVLLDFDRARLVRGALPFQQRRRNLRRLRRSLTKLDPTGVLAGSAELRAFGAAYVAAAGAPCAS